MLSNKEIVRTVWDTINCSIPCDIHELSKKCAEAVVVVAMEKKSNDNLTVIFIGKLFVTYKKNSLAWFE